MLNGARFVAAVEAIYAAAPDPSLWPNALQKIADCFDDFGTVLLWQRDDGSFGTIVSAGLEAAQQDYVQNGWNRRDLSAIRAVERGLWLKSDALTDRHGVSDEEMATHPFYTEFMARHGLRWRAAVGVAPDPHIAAAISVQRSAAKDPFSDAELIDAARLGRHVEGALRLSIRLLDAELGNVGMRDALSRLGIGVFALDSLSRVVFKNAVGDRLLGDGLELVDGRLRANTAAFRTQVERAIAGDFRDFVAEPKPLLIERAHAARPLTIYTLPIIGGPCTTREFLTHARAIVLVIDPQADTPPDPAVVRDVLGLTLGEARVAALVGAGMAPRDAAERLGITEESARTTLKRVFSKVGVSRQSELTGLLTRLVLR